MLDEFFVLLHQLHISSPIFCSCIEFPACNSTNVSNVFLRCRFPNSQPNCIDFRANSLFLFFNCTDLHTMRKSFLDFYLFLSLSLSLLFFLPSTPNLLLCTFKRCKFFPPSVTFFVLFCHELHAINKIKAPLLYRLHKDGTKKKREIIISLSASFLFYFKANRNSIKTFYSDSKTHTFSTAHTIRDHRINERTTHTERTNERKKKNYVNLLAEKKCVCM